MNRKDIINSIVAFYKSTVGHLNGMAEAAKIMENSLLIPSPMFKIGDKVKSLNGDKTKWEIEGRYYSPDEEKWYYTDFTDVIDYSESELELAERKEE